MRKTELIVSGEVIYPKTKASIVDHEHTNIEECLDQQNRTSSTITQSASTSKVGLGDDVDLSFCVEDGFYESATFYGKTLVNRIQEPSSKDVVLPYEFADGHYVTINDTKESGALGVELKGQTLVNMAKNKSCDKSNAVGEVNISAKPNTTYIAFFDGTYDKEATAVNFAMFCTSPVYVENTTGLNGDGLYTATVSGHGGNEHRWNPSLNYTKFTTSSNQNYIHIRTGGGKTNIKYDNMRIFEYQDGMENWVIPYFEGMQSVQAPTLKTVGKNLFDISRMNEVKWGNGHTIDLSNNSLTTSDNNAHVTGNGYVITGLKKNTPYRLTVTSDSSSGGTANFNVCSRDGSVWWEQRIYSIPIGSTQSRIIYTDTGSLKVTANAHIPVGCTVTLKDIQIEEVASENVQPTTYEPYKSSILSLPEEVVLRSLPNGVCDTFNTRTGVYTQRIGDDTFTGASNENWRIPNNYTTGDTLPFRITKPTMQGNGSVIPTDIICDKMKIETPRNAWGNDSYDKEGLSHGTGKGDGIDVRILKSKLTTHDVAGFKTWLSQNPIRVQYQLHTPVITKINLPSTLKSWNTTTHIYSEISENTLYPILSHSNPTYPVILKPSTKYSIVANSYSNNHTNSAVNFNLGGATTSTTVGNRVTTITTPSTLSNELLTMSGRGNKLNHVMVIEGEVVGDEPYFEGICDCKSPILSNVGKNLFTTSDKNITGTFGVEYSIDNNEVTVWKDELGWYNVRLDWFNLVPNQKYCLSYNTEIISGNPYDLILIKNDKEETIYPDSNGCFISPDNGKVALRFYSGKDTMKGKIRYYNIQLEQVTKPTSYESYKSNILSCNGDKIELTADMFEQGNVGGSDKAGSTYEETKKTSDSRIRLISLLSVKPNTTYHMSCDSNYKMGVRLFDVNGLFTGEYHEWYDDFAFTTNSNTKYVTIKMKKNDNATITPTIISEAQPELREVDKTVVLRSLPNGVCDTLNIETGEYVQRIGETTLIGREDWVKWPVGYQDLTMGFKFTHPTDTKGYSYALTSHFLNGPSGAVNVDTECYHIGSAGASGIRIKKSKLNTEDVEGLKQWLSENPVVVQYELTTPIVKTVDLSGYPFAYKDGHVILSSGSIEPSLTPKIEYVVQTNRTGAIQANQDRLLNHDKRLAMLEDLVIRQLIQLEYNRAKSTFLSQTRQIVERGIQMYHTKYELLSEFIEKKLYRSLEEVFEMLDVYFMLGDITDGEYDALYEALMPSAEEIFEAEEAFDHEDVEV